MSQLTGGVLIQHAPSLLPPSPFLALPLVVIVLPLSVSLVSHMLSSMGAEHIRSLRGSGGASRTPVTHTHDGSPPSSLPFHPFIAQKHTTNRRGGRAPAPSSRKRDTQRERGVGRHSCANVIFNGYKATADETCGVGLRARGSSSPRRGSAGMRCILGAHRQMRQGHMSVFTKRTSQCVFLGGGGYNVM